MKKILLKDVCFRCGTFDNTRKSFYKCALKGSCPGINWSVSKRQHVIHERKRNDTNKR